MYNFYLDIFFYLLESFVNFIQIIFEFSIPAPPNPFLQGNFKPVSDEIEGKELSVFPPNAPFLKDLEGEFVRNGPNPKYVPRGGYHWFDGDGMLHGVQILNGKVNYVNRFIQTERLKRETEAGHDIYPRLGTLEGILGLMRVIITKIKVLFGFIGPNDGTANTAVQFHDGRLLALVENDAPYAVKILIDGQFETIGKHSYRGRLTHSVSAHAKVDPETNEFLLFGYKLDKKPFIHYSIVNPKGELTQTVPIHINNPVMMHDFAITKNYSIFLDLPLEFVKENLVKRKPVYEFKKNKPSRLGITDRYAKQPIRWFEFESGYIFHTINAFEEKNEKGEEIVKVLGCRFAEVDLALTILSETKNKPFPYIYEINLTTGDKKEAPLSTTSCEFPVVHPKLLGRPFQYFYAASTLYDGPPLLDGIVKHDFKNRDSNGHAPIVGKITFGKNRYGGEAVFVPKKKSTSEDDGYLLTFVYDEHTLMSEFVVFDAKTMSNEPVGRVPLPQRVPYGFHGLWIDQQSLDNQNDLPIF